MIAVPGAGSTGFEVVLKGGVDAASTARHAIAEHAPGLSQTALYDVELLVSELVSNAVRHGGAAEETPLFFDFRRYDGHVRVELLHPGSTFKPPGGTPPTGDSSGGWGLFLVDRVADRWGVRPGASGTCVWFEVPVT